MIRRVTLVSGFALIAFSTAGAQDRSPSYTQMILGGGPFPLGPVYTLGFAHKPAGSSVSWRLMTEYYERSLPDPDRAGTFFSATTTYGLQALGVRTFRETRRFQPYLLGGVGLYHTDHMFRDRTVTWTDSGFVTLADRGIGRRQSVIPTFIWGTGLNLRISGVTLFGEVKLPIYSTNINAFRWGPQAPLTFGIRF